MCLHNPQGNSVVNELNEILDELRVQSAVDGAWSQVELSQDRAHRPVEGPIVKDRAQSRAFKTVAPTVSEVSG
jgi:hypothetical protein